MFSSAFLLGLVGTTAAATVSIPAGDSRVAWAGEQMPGAFARISRSGSIHAGCHSAPAGPSRAHGPALVRGAGLVHVAIASLHMAVAGYTPVGLMGSAR